MPGVRSSNSVTPMSCARSMAALSRTVMDAGICSSGVGARVAVTMMPLWASASAGSCASAGKDRHNAISAVEFLSNRLDMVTPHDLCRAHAGDASRSRHATSPAQSAALPVVMRVYPRPPGSPCPRERRRRQAGLLACGSAPVGRLLGTSPNGIGPMAHRIQLQGQPGFTRSHLSPRLRGTCRVAAVTSNVIGRSITPGRFVRPRLRAFRDAPRRTRHYRSLTKLVVVM